jgi:hypothetical protein
LGQERPTCDLSLLDAHCVRTENTDIFGGDDMEKIWDSSLSLLVNSNPQAFLDLLLSGAVLLRQHHTKLGGTQRQPDVVLEVERYREIFLFNPELRAT